MYRRAVSARANGFFFFFVKNYRHGPGWIGGTIVQQNGPLSYDVQVAEESGTGTATSYVVAMDQCKPQQSKHPRSAAKPHRMPRTLITQRRTSLGPLHLK